MRINIMFNQSKPRLKHKSAIPNIKKPSEKSLILLSLHGEYSVEVYLSALSNSQGFTFLMCTLDEITITAAI